MHCLVAGLNDNPTNNAPLLTRTSPPAASVDCTTAAARFPALPARPARKVDDLWRQVSWLTALALTPAFPTCSPRIQGNQSVAVWGEHRRLQLRGQSRH
jgi:hypothetical protein